MNKKNILFAALLATALPVLTFAADKPSVDPIDEVNTFIGTKDEGNTFPGASAPFGMIQVSPIGTHYAGWQYDDTKIRGFGHFFLSGAGCDQQGGLVSILPVTGTIGAGAKFAFDVSNPDAFDQARYAAAYTHQGEIGRPGYYKVRLTDYGGIDAETSALTRVGAERYTFANATNDAHVFVNLGQATVHHRVLHSDIRVVDERTVEGSLETLSFCGGSTYTTWFRLEFDRPFKAFGTWSKLEGVPDSRESSTIEGPNGAWFTFDTTQSHSVAIVSAISQVDADGARNNLRVEGYLDGKPFDFDRIRQGAQDTWRRELSSVRVRGGTRDDRVVFYTSLYHTLLQPLTASDVDGRYRGWDGRLHKAAGWTYYDFFSLWDIYRAQSQMIAILRPNRARDIARSVVTIAEQGGWLPRWAYASFETNTMTGDPVTPFLADLWKYGALDGEEAKRAYVALKQNADGMPPASWREEGRAGNINYIARGFVEYDKDHPKKSMDLDQEHAASATFEYAQADCALSLMARGLGETADAQRWSARSGNWRNLWDESVADSEHAGFKGFPRPKTLDGNWYSPQGKPYSPTSEDGFHEGTAWQYQWLEQQDVPALAKAMGGLEQTHRRLDVFFAIDKLLADPLHAARREWVMGAYDYYNQFRYNPNNEPDLHSPWMYTLTGAPWKTAVVLRAAQTLFTDGPSGVTGNDDLGTMSAWYMFSALGIYPGMPGTGTLLLHTPRFEHAEIDLAGGKTLTIDAPGADGGKLQYIENAQIDGHAQTRVFTDWDALRRGATIRYALIDKPPVWGTHQADLPPAACPAIAAK
jgi:predicted alpha-1,2-mannosidase